MSTRLHSLYIGSRDIDRDVAAFTAMGARLVWRFRRFGADVAGARLPDGTLAILADHRPEGSVLPLVEVASLSDPSLPQGGHTAETPDGTCRVFKLPGGAEIGFIEVTRPNALEGAFENPDNSYAVRK
jgi:hypothetical protein